MCGSRTLSRRDHDPSLTESNFSFGNLINLPEKSQLIIEALAEFGKRKGLGWMGDQKVDEPHGAGGCGGVLGHLASRASARPFSAGSWRS